MILIIWYPPHELPTLVLYRKYRVKPAFPAGPDSVSLKDYRKQTQISRERVSQLIQVRREVRILYLQGLLKSISHFNITCQSTHSGSTWARSQRQHCALPIKNELFLGKTKKNKKNIFWDTLRPDSKKMVFCLGKNMVLDRKTNFFLRKNGFGVKTLLTFS